ncbi:MAG: NACHT domain-containing protein, partial [Pseudanabaena sp.]
MVVEISFDGYLRSLVSKYERSQDGYTQTDAKDWVDFGLMVQTVDKEKGESKKEKEEGEQEKIERLPVLDGIRKYAGQHDLGNHVLLVGRPGSGKSTALQKMLFDEAQKTLNGQSNGQSALIPVLIELRSWRTSYIALIKDFFRAHKLRLDDTAIDDLLFEGKLLLLVDGVNELPANENARQDIINLRETNPHAPMIFTTRVLGVGGDLG